MRNPGTRSYTADHDRYVEIKGSWTPDTHSDLSTRTSCGDPSRSKGPSSGLSVPPTLVRGGVRDDGGRTWDRHRDPVRDTSLSTASMAYSPYPLRAPPPRATVSET